MKSEYQKHHNFCCFHLISFAINLTVKMFNVKKLIELNLINFKHHFEAVNTAQTAQTAQRVK